MSWVAWSLMEGLGLGVSRLFFSLGGDVSPSLAHILFAAVCAGCFQVFFGGAMALIKKERILTSGLWHTLGPVALGIGGLIANVCAFAAFQAVARADMASSNFLATVPVVLLGAFFGWLIFSEALGWRQGVGLACAIGGAYLTIPLSFAALWKSGLPVWVWFSLGTALFATVNEFISKGMARWEIRHRKPKLNPWALQFWGGMSMIAVALGGFMFFAEAGARMEILATDMLWMYGIGAGASNVGWWTCRLLAYQKEAPVSIRRFPTIGVSLLTATAIGAVGFGGSFLPKVPGIILFVPAFFFGQNGSEKYLHLREVWDFIYPRVLMPPATSMRGYDDAIPSIASVTMEEEKMAKVS